MKKSDTLIPKEMIERSILLLRGHKVMLDRDLAVLYGVTTGALNQAVRRNLERFPKDFMFQLTPAEKKNWMSQIVISNREKMGIRHRPFAFTENGVAMLSSVLMRTALNFFHPARRTSSSFRGELLPPSAASFFHFVIPPATV